MAKFEVTITETLERQIVVEAASKIDAVKQAQKDYYFGDVILNADDFTDINFDVYEIPRKDNKLGFDTSAEATMEAEHHE